MKQKISRNYGCEEDIVVAFFSSFSSVTGKLVCHFPTAHMHIYSSLMYNPELTKSEALPHQATRGHVLLSLDLTKIEGT